MKKTFLLVVLMILIGINYANAQSSLIAILSHENDVKVFYGASALKEAHAAAVGGDVITLSSGTFNACTITKAVTLRGAGMAVDTVNNVMPTILTGSFNINIADTLNRFTLEGIYNNHSIYCENKLKNPMFIKCRFNTIKSPQSADIIENACFVHCRISKDFKFYSQSNATFINCILGSTAIDYSVSEYINCIINEEKQYSYNSISLSGTYINCIIITNTGKDGIGGIAYNCVSYLNIFSNVPNSTNKSGVILANLFKTYTGGAFENLDSESFELTEEAKTKYLGTDGTQVGIYGGSMPFDITPTNPRITKCNVAAKSTVDGKLSVDIQVNAVE